MLHDIFSMYRHGEIIPFIILAILTNGYVIIFEKIILLQFVYRVNFETYNSQLKKMLLANDLDRAKSFSRAISRTGVPMLAVKAIDAYENEPMRVRCVLSEESLRFFPRVRQRLTQLPNLAAGCVILGTLAAIEGIWNSFRMVEGLELSIKSFSFAAGLTHALLPLALALACAALLIIPFGILDAMAWRLEAEIEHSLCIVLNILSPELQPSFISNVSSSIHPPHEPSPPIDDMPNHPQGETQKSPIKNEGENGKLSTAATIPDEEEII